MSHDLRPGGQSARNFYVPKPPSSERKTTVALYRQRRSGSLNGQPIATARPRTWAEIDHERARKEKTAKQQAEGMLVTCWCERQMVRIPVKDVGNHTESCGHASCKPPSEG